MLNKKFNSILDYAEKRFSFDAHYFVKNTLWLLTGQGMMSIAGFVSTVALANFVSGHFVSGHVDCLGLVRRKSLRNGNLEFAVAVPPLFMKYCFLKGSISLDGISLTLADKRANILSVYIIPHTLKNTTLNFKGPSSKLNVEFDILAKRAAV